RNALHHFTDPENGLKEIRRMLKPDGFFTLIEPVPPNLIAKPLWSSLFMIRDKGRYPEFYYTPEELIDFVKSDFELIASDSNQIEIPMSNWSNIDSLTDSEIDKIHELLKNSSDDERDALGIYSQNEHWQMTHSWSLLKLKKLK
ncbi:MAG: class I SAM-dependent methyltransferase, partial [bacterium]